MKKIDWNLVLKTIKTVSGLIFLGSIIYACTHSDIIDNTVLPPIITVFSMIFYSITSSFVKKK